MNDWEDRYPQLRGIKCIQVAALPRDQPSSEHSPVDTVVRLSDGTRLRAEYWRLFEGGEPGMSSFDHGQVYGLGAPLDAPRAAHQALAGKALIEVLLHRTTADLRLRFEGGGMLEVFNFTSYEVWDIQFPDGTRDFSNHVLKA